MKIIGIEFAASDMNYVVLNRDECANISVASANRLSLGGTRSPEALRTFQQAFQTIVKDVSPSLIAIKAKPEKGSMMAGPAALKMEALVLANVSCEVRFISGARINKCSPPDASLNAYHLPAYKAAVSSLDD
jgi:hypothetical protein